MRPSPPSGATVLAVATLAWCLGGCAAQREALAPQDGAPADAAVPDAADAPQDDGGTSPLPEAGLPLPDAGLPPPVWDDLGVTKPADFTCPGQLTDCDLPLYQGITCPPDPGFTVRGEVRDFQSNENITTAISATAVATVTVYETVADALANQPLVAPVHSDSASRYGVVIPKSLTRVIFKTTLAGAMDTFEFGQLVVPGQTDSNRASVAKSTGDFVAAWVGVTLDPAKGTVIGAVRDCGYHLVANAIVRGLNQDGSLAIPDENVFYFAAAAGLPVKRSKRIMTDIDGRFLLLNVPPATGEVRVQAFVALAGTVTVVSDASVPVMAGAITMVELDPLVP